MAAKAVAERRRLRPAVPRDTARLVALRYVAQATTQYESDRRYLSLHSFIVKYTIGMASPKNSLLEPCDVYFDNTYSSFPC